MLERTEQNNNQEISEVVENYEGSSQKEMEITIGSQAEEVRDFLITMDNDLQKIETDTSLEANEFRQGLLVLQEEAKNLEKSLWQKVGDVLATPVRYVQKFFEARNEQELLIEDNKKIIEKLEEKIRNISSQCDKYRKKIKQTNDFAPVLYPQEIMDGICEVSAEYKRAKKKDVKKWEHLSNTINKVVSSQIKARLPSHTAYISFPDNNREKYAIEVRDHLQECMKLNTVLVGPVTSYTNEDYNTAKILLRSALMFDRVENSPNMKIMKEQGMALEMINKQKKVEENALLLEFPDMHSGRLYAYYGDIVDPDIQLGMIKKVLDMGDTYPLSQFYIHQLPKQIQEKISPEERKKIYTAYQRHKFDFTKYIVNNKDFFYDQINSLPEKEIKDLIKSVCAVEPYYAQSFFSTFPLPKDMVSEIPQEIFNNPSVLMALRNADVYGLTEQEDKLNYFAEKEVVMNNFCTSSPIYIRLLASPEIYGIHKQEALSMFMRSAEKFVKDSGWDANSTLKEIFTVVQSGVLQEYEITKLKDMVMKYMKKVNKLLTGAQDSDAEKFFFGIDQSDEPKMKQEKIVEAFKDATVTGEGMKVLYAHLHKAGRTQEAGEMLVRFVQEAEPQELWESLKNNPPNNYWENQNLQGVEFSDSEKEILFGKMMDAGEAHAAILLFSDEEFMFAHFSEERIVTFLRSIKDTDCIDALRKIAFGEKGGHLVELCDKYPEIYPSLREEYFNKVPGDEAFKSIQYGDHKKYSEQEYALLVDRIVQQGSPQSLYGLLSNVDKIEEIISEKPLVQENVIGGFQSYFGGFGQADKYEKKSLLPYIEKITSGFVQRASPEFILQVLNGKEIEYFSKDQVKILVSEYVAKGDPVQVYTIYKRIDTFPHEAGLEEIVKNKLTAETTADFVVSTLIKDTVFISQLNRGQQDIIIHRAVEYLDAKKEVLDDITRLAYEGDVKERLVKAVLMKFPENIAFISDAGKLFPEYVQSVLTDYAKKRSWGSGDKSTELQLMFAYVKANIFTAKEGCDVLKIDTWQTNELPDQFLQFLSIADFHPWSKGLEHLQKIQAFSSRTEHCPWAKELMPLLRSAKDKKLISFEKSEDVELLTSYVQDFGAFNMPIVFELFAQIKRGENIKGLLAQKEYADKISNFFGNERIKKLQDGNELLNEIKKAKRALQGDLLADKIPANITSVLGEEMFNALRGSTKWGRGDSLPVLLEMWNNATQQNPELAKLSEHYDEKTYAVDTVTETVVDSEKATKEKTEILGNKNVLEQWKRLIAPMQEIMQVETKNVGNWYGETVQKIVAELELQIDSLNSKMDTLPEQGKKGTLINIKKMMDFIEAIKAVSIHGSQELAISSGLEELAKVGIQFEKDKKLRAIIDDLIYKVSLLHVRQSGQGEHAVQMEKFAVRPEQPDESSLLEYAQFMAQYVAEHYLNDQQKKEHTGHTPFGKELLKKLLNIWQVEKDLEKGHPLIQAAKKIELANRGKSVKSGATRNISFVPVRGVMRIFSGDVGDACYTSQHVNLAKGQFPGITAVMMVTNRESAQERIEGSVLFVETKTPQGESALIVRANNPRSNLLSKTDPDSLVKTTLDYAIDVAKKRGFDKVVVPKDKATASSSNRTEVAAYYQQKYADAQSIRLVNEPETNFNNYDIWNGTTVEVWNKNQQG